MIINRYSQILFEKSSELFNNYKSNCVVVRQMLQKYKKEFPNISDYSIMNFIDISEFCDLLLDEHAIKTLNEDECYCLLMAALFTHTGFGLSKNEVDSYILQLGMEEEVKDLTRVQIMRKWHILFSVCLLEQYDSIFEFPSESHKYSILRIMKYLTKKSPDIDKKDNNLPLENGNVIRLNFLASILSIGNHLAELKNSNMDLTYDDFAKYDSVEIVDFIERNAVRSIGIENRTLVVKARGSDTVYTLIKRKIDSIKMVFHDIIDNMNDNKTLLSFDTIELRRILSTESTKDIYINKEIEESWSKEDLELFRKLSFEEKSFYVDYLSAEFGITKFLMDFSQKNNALLEGLDYRVKSPGSLYNKLHQRKEKKSFDTVADVIRYTIILDPDFYVADITKSIESLKATGWKIYSLKNYWKSKDFPYNGVNAKFKNEHNYRAEIQFHTQESFDVKMSEKDHQLYEERRVLEPGCDEYNRILQLQLQLYSNMKFPKGIDLLDNI